MIAIILVPDTLPKFAKQFGDDSTDKVSLRTLKRRMRRMGARIVDDTMPMSHPVDGKKLIMLLVDSRDQVEVEAAKYTQWALVGLRDRSPTDDLDGDGKPTYENVDDGQGGTVRRRKRSQKNHILRKTVLRKYLNRPVDEKGVEQPLPANFQLPQFAIRGTVPVTV